MKKAAKPVKPSNIKPSASGLAVAAALDKEFPKDADRIIQIMAAAAESRQIKKPLLRIQVSLAALRNGGGK